MHVTLPVENKVYFLARTLLGQLLPHRHVQDALLR